jgi:hypothetical protein
LVSTPLSCGALAGAASPSLTSTANFGQNRYADALLLRTVPIPVARLTHSVEQGVDMVRLAFDQDPWLDGPEQRLRAHRIADLGVGLKSTGYPRASTSACILVVSVPRDRPRAVFLARRHCADGHARWWHRPSCIRCRDHRPGPGKRYREPHSPPID